MGLLSPDQRLATVVSETSLLVSALDGADLGVPVPTCPGWTLNQLLRHLGFRHRSTSEVHSVEGYAGETAAELMPWLTEGAAQLSATVDGVLARRLAHETWVHRFDAFTALGMPFEISRDVAWDALWEWMGRLLSERRPALDALLGKGHKLRFLATDYTNASPRWTVDLSGDAPAVLRDSVVRCSVYVQAPIADLVLTLYGRRRPAKSEMTGDIPLLRAFLEAVRF